jgi:tRNA (guanine-N7-)-methyltransferase
MTGASSLLRLAELSLPCAADGLFGRRSPVGLDLGFGDGRFLALMAGARPDWDWVGAEVSAVYVLRAMRRVAREGLANVRLYHGPAELLVRHVLARASVREVFVNFPDPWPKSRHQSRRLLRAPFLELLSARLVRGGLVCLTTDDEAYYRFVLEEAAATGLYEAVPSHPPAPVLATKYAAKWRSAGRPVYHLALRQTGEAALRVAPIGRPTMPHAVLSGSLPEEVRFEKRVWVVGGARVVLLEACRALGDGHLVLLAEVQEDGLGQQVMIEARAHPRGVIVRLCRFGDPLITPGVKAAVGCIAEFLAEQGLSVVQRTY